jgi:hypothetical protein
MKYTDEQKEKFRDLVAQGKPLKTAAAEAGISLAIGLKIRGEENRKQREESAPPPAEKQEEEPEENLSEGDVPPPSSGSGGASDGAGARGADGARSALKDEDDPEEKEDDQAGADQKAAEEKKAAEDAERKKNQLDPAEILVNLSEMLCSGMVWIFARRKKIKLTARQKEELAWSEEERAHLLRHARSAAAALPGFIILLGPYVGLAFYAWILFKVTEGRCEQVAEWGPRKREDDDEEEIKDAQWEEKKPDDPLTNMRESW